MAKYTIFGGPQACLADTAEEALAIGDKLSQQGFAVRYNCQGKRIESMEEFERLKAEEEAGNA